MFSTPWFIQHMCIHSHIHFRLHVPTEWITYCTSWCSHANVSFTYIILPTWPLQGTNTRTYRNLKNQNPMNTNSQQICHDHCKLCISSWLMSQTSSALCVETATAQPMSPTKPNSHGKWFQAHCVSSLRYSSIAAFPTRLFFRKATILRLLIDDT